MEESEDKVNLMPGSKVKKKDTSLFNVSRSILQDYRDSSQDGLINSSNCFIPFNKERDGMNRLIKSNSQKLSKSPKRIPKSLFQDKKFVPYKKVLLKSPTACETPAVGTYSLITEWQKHSFSRKSPKYIKQIRQNKLSPMKKKPEVHEKRKKYKSFEQAGKKRDFSLIEKRKILVPRQKGVWEGMVIKDIIKEHGLNSIEDCAGVFAFYETSIASSMKKFKLDMNNIQKYLK